MHSKPRTTSWFWLIIIIILSFSFSTYIVTGLWTSGRVYDQTATVLESEIYSGRVGKVEFPGVDGELSIPDWQIFRPDHLWSLVAFNEPLQSDFIPSDLVDTKLPHGDEALPMKLSQRIESPLTKLFVDSENAGHPLMMSSAYRSIEEQQTLLNQFIANRGISAAEQYVAKPGTSEHHTGFSVDLSDRSNACATDSNRCLIATPTSNWLAEHAHEYGFILRYPEGKQPITGISFEPWHYRYVGIPLATKIYESDLTLDEALAQMYPAFAIVKD